MKARRDDTKRSTHTIPEAALIAGSGEAAIRKGINEGRIPHIRFGRKILIPKVAFQKWIDTAGDFAAAS